MALAEADRIVSFILSGPLLSLDTRSERHDKGRDHARQGGTRYGCDIRSGGTIYSAADGPGGPILKGDYPRRDRLILKKPIGSAPAYQAQCTLPPQLIYQTLLSIFQGSGSETTVIRLLLKSVAYIARRRHPYIKSLPTL